MLFFLWLYFFANEESGNAKMDASVVFYWGVLLVALAVMGGALIFLRLTRRNVAYAVPAGVISDGESASAPEHASRVAHAAMRYVNGRLIVTVSDGTSAFPFLIDTAFGHNAISRALFTRLGGSARDSVAATAEETTQMVTSTVEDFPVATLPAGLMVGTYPFDSRGQKTVVLSLDGSPFEGILGKPFLTAPGAATVLLDIPRGVMTINADARDVATSAEVIYQTQDVDPVFGLFLIEAAVRTRHGVVRGRFALDTGARRVIIGQRVAEQTEWAARGEQSTLSMSGHETDTRVHGASVSIGHDAAPATTRAVFVVGRATEKSLLNTEAFDGLLGVESLRAFRILIVNHGDRPRLVILKPR